MEQKIKLTQIQEDFNHWKDSEPERFIAVYGEDERSAVKKMVERAEKLIEAGRKEKERMYQMFAFEREYAAYEYICGIDEAGRGPLAGPVVAGAVILPKDCSILYLNDSKKLSEKKREELYDIIMKEAISVGIGYASPERIDEINILNATYEAMKDAVAMLDPAPDILLNDAVTLPGLSVRQIPIIKGDAKSASIAAASIIAKVTRDRLMVQYDSVMPQYGFAGHKGYGSAAHIAAIKEYGPSPIHRKSFIKNFVD